ncbi:MAG: DUF6515 family protein [Candidatus Cryptobacteroides sp.]
MSFINFTFTALIAGALALSPAASAQTRRESRPERSTQSTKVEKPSKAPSKKPDKPAAKPAQKPSTPTTKPDSKPSTKPGTGRRPAPGADKPSKKPAQTKPADNPSSKPSGTNSNTGRRPAPGADRPVNNRPEAGFRDPHQPPRVPPYERRPISYRNPSRFYDHGHHYYGYRINSLPHHHEVRICWGHRYYLCDGIYYRLYNGHYYVCRPPYGYYFAPSVYAYTPALCSFAYYSYWNRQYNIINENFRVIEEQNRLIAQNNALLAQQNAELRAQDAEMSQRSSNSYMLAKRLGLIQSYAAIGVNYYYDDGVFFVLNSKGEYETIIPPAGAIIDNLPDDFTVVTLSDGKEYYLVDETVYMVVINEGKAVFEVLGQLQS